MIRFFVMLVVVVFILAPIRTVPVHADAPAESPRFDPIEKYAEQTVEGWRVLVHRDLLNEQKTSLRERTLKLLGDHLYRITTVVPESAVVDLRKIPIWVEVAHPKHPCMCYHPGAAWLRENGMNPEKEGAVELANCENFLKWTKDQPWMVLHELAHGYHDRFLEQGFNNPAVLSAYQNAKQAKSYDSILRLSGRKEKAYAMNNQQEYFAEQTEAYFGTNDFYPFVSAELRGHDPQMYELLGKLWKAK